LEQQSKILLAVLNPVDSRFSFEEMHDYLYQRGFTIYPGKGASKKTFRLAIVGDLYREDINNFLSTLAEYIELRELKIAD
jgi:2-aminoethylphosphonate-pyruvate transaminase